MIIIFFFMCAYFVSFCILNVLPPRNDECAFTNCMAFTKCMDSLHGMMNDGQPMKNLAPWLADAVDTVLQQTMTLKTIMNILYKNDAELHHTPLGFFMRTPNFSACAIAHAEKKLLDWIYNMVILHPSLGIPFFFRSNRFHDS